MTPQTSVMEKNMIRWLKDHGYKVEGNTIISIGVRGFTSDRIFGHCRNILDAVEMLQPIVGDIFVARTAKVS